MDDLDLKIVDVLRHDGRASNSGIARQMGVSEGTIRRRLNRLIGEDLIEFRVTVRARGSERTIQSLVGLQVDPADLDSVLERVSDFDEVIFAASATGVFDLLVWVEAKSLDDLGSFLVEYVGKVPGVLRTESFIVLTVGKNATVN